MKTKTTKSLIFSVVAFFSTVVVSAQTNITLIRRSLISGAEKKQGAVYRFSTAKSNVDAIVTIAKLTRSASLDSFTTSGTCAEMLQPEVSIAARSWGYVTFKIQFVKAGTMIPAEFPDMPARGSNYVSNDSNVKLDVMSSSSSSFKVRMYSVNPHAHSLNIKADVFLQTFVNDNNMEVDEMENAVAHATM